MPKTKATKQAAPIERPTWVLDTPAMFYTLEARVTDFQVEPLQIELSIEEFDFLKKQLAIMRGYLPEVAND